MHNETTIGTLIKDEQWDKASRSLVALLRKSKGNIVHAALACGVHHATLKRWIVKIDDATWNDVRGQLDQMRETHTSTPMSAAEREEKLDEVKEQRERVRAHAWLQRTSAEQRADIAEAVGVRTGVVTRMANAAAPTNLTSLVWNEVRTLASAQRARWRSKRKTRENRRKIR